MIPPSASSRNRRGRGLPGLWQASVTVPISDKAEAEPQHRALRLRLPCRRRRAKAERVRERQTEGGDREFRVSSGPAAGGSGAAAQCQERRSIAPFSGSRRFSTVPRQTCSNSAIMQGRPEKSCAPSLAARQRRDIRDGGQGRMRRRDAGTSAPPRETSQRSAAPRVGRLRRRREADPFCPAKLLRRRFPDLRRRRKKWM